MDDTTGIQLSVNVDSLLTSYGNAIKSLNEEISKTTTNKIKIEVDQTNIKEVIKTIKADLSSISGDISGLNVKINSNDIKSQINDVLNGKTSNAEVVSEKSVKKQKTALDEITKAYMEQFNIVKKTKELAPEQMFGNFKNAISDVYEAKAAGDVEKLGTSIQRLIELTQTYTKPFKNTDAVNHLNDLKNALEGVVPISEKVWKDLKLIYGGANGARGALSQAFGIKGWNFGGKSDVFTDNLPDWVIDKNEIHNETDAIQQLIEVMRNARAEAKIKTNIFDSGALTNSDIEKFINENYELIKVKQNQSQVDDNVIRKENEIVTSVKQSAQAFKDYQSVLSELNRLEESGMGKVES